MHKPILFHDIDGVLFGYYGPSGNFQLRPGLGDWLVWTWGRFEVIWLTSWRERELRELLATIWPRSSPYRIPATPEELPVKVADWYTAKSKEAWIREYTATRPSLEWYWLDDNIPPVESLRSLCLDPSRCISVDPRGASALEHVQQQLSERFSAMASSPPKSRYKI